jgi:hypothetical protein
MDVDPGRVLAFRLAAHGVAAPSADPGDALRGWAVQDSPPGAATTALLARTEPLPTGWVDARLEERAVVALYNPRTATAVLPAGDAATFAAALLPTDDAGLRAIVASSLPERREGFAEPVARAVGAVADALDGVVLSRDDLHEALRQRLPLDMLPWCRSCESHHARRGLLVMAALHGRLCHAGRAGRQPAFARTDQWTGWSPPAPAAAGAELVRRYLAGYGPSTPAHLAQWAGVAPAHVRRLWDAAGDELAEVRVDGLTRAWALARDLPRLQDPPPAPGVRLIGPGDPLVLARDREVLVPGEAARKQVWRAIAGAGVVLADGRAAGLWRARKQGRRLTVAVEAPGRLPKRAVAAAAERLAPHRGCETAELEWVRVAR